MECPKCGKAVKRPVGWFRRKPDCPHGCGASFDDPKLQRDLDSAEEGVRKLFDNISGRHGGD